MCSAALDSYSILLSFLYFWFFFSGIILAWTALHFEHGGRCTVGNEGGLVSKFYKDSVVFITGGTGFLGKVLVEKLLRVFLIKRIYLLVRAKNNLTVNERLEQYFRESVTMGFLYFYVISFLTIWLKCGTSSVFQMACRSIANNNNQIKKEIFVMFALEWTSKMISSINIYIHLVIVYLFLSRSVYFQMENIIVSRSSTDYETNHQMSSTKWKQSKPNSIHMTWI